MTFFEITDTHQYVDQIRFWYEEAFPVAERRHFDDLLALLPYPDMHLCALLTDAQLVGFMLYWQWPECTFVEYLVIDPAQRGKQLGQQAIDKLLQIECSYLILEVERPETESSHRRIRFYERQGFTLNSYDYWQPPYQPGMPTVPMRLMSVPALTREEDFRAFSELIKSRVYERFYS